MVQNLPESRMPWESLAQPSLVLWPYNLSSLHAPFARRVDCDLHTCTCTHMVMHEIHVTVILWILGKRCMYNVHVYFVSSLLSTWKEKEERVRERERISFPPKMAKMAISISLPICTYSDMAFPVKFNQIAASHEAYLYPMCILMYLYLLYYACCCSPLCLRRWICMHSESFLFCVFSYLSFVVHGTQYA